MIVHANFEVGLEAHKHQKCFGLYIKINLLVYGGRPGSGVAELKEAGE